MSAALIATRDAVRHGDRGANGRRAGAEKQIAG